MWRSTFSTTTMASSTTRPTDSTIASSVSRFSVKPNACIRKTAPISETGIATIGTSTVRSEPRNRKITSITISTVSAASARTSWMALSMYLVESKASGACMPVGRSRLDGLHLFAHAADHVERVGVRQHPDAHEHGLLAGQAHVLVVVVGAQHHVGHVLEPHQRAVLLADRPAA